MGLILPHFYDYVDFIIIPMVRLDACASTLEGECIQLAQLNSEVFTDSDTRQADSLPRVFGLSISC